jgi:hypothetical protein
MFVAGLVGKHHVKNFHRCRYKLPQIPCPVKNQAVNKRYGIQKWFTLNKGRLDCFVGGVDFVPDTDIKTLADYPINWVCCYDNKTKLTYHFNHKTNLGVRMHGISSYKDDDETTDAYNEYSVYDIITADRLVKKMFGGDIKRIC